MIAPSPNTCLEPQTYQMLGDRTDVTVEFTRFEVARIALDAGFGPTVRRRTHGGGGTVASHGGGRHRCVGRHGRLLAGPGDRPPAGRRDHRAESRRPPRRRWPTSTRSPHSASGTWACSPLYRRRQPGHRRALRRRGTSVVGERHLGLSVNEEVRTGAARRPAAALPRAGRGTRRASGRAGLRAHQPVRRPCRRAGRGADRAAGGSTRSPSRCGGAWRSPARQPCSRNGAGCSQPHRSRPIPGRLPG